MPAASRFLVILFVVLSIPRLAFAWSGEGHKLVGAIADDLIAVPGHENTKAAVQALLGAETLSTVSVWADCAKGFTYCQRQPTPEEKAYAKANPLHHHFHFTDIPIQEDHYVKDGAGTRPEDAVQVLKEAIAVLKGDTHVDTPVKFDPAQRSRNALWLLVHVLGDLHQPLHVGAIYRNPACDQTVDPATAGVGMDNFGIGTKFAGTQGANLLLLSASSSNSLHHRWDLTEVSKTYPIAKDDDVDADVKSYADTIVSQAPPNWQTPGPIEQWPEKWADESLHLARSALTRITIDNGTAGTDPDGITCQSHITLKANYDTWASKRANDQVIKAGYRLAALLEAIFP